MPRPIHKHAPVPGAEQAVLSREVAAVGLRIADRAAVCDIETDGVRDFSRAGGPWYDIRPMTDEREHAGEWISMAREAIDWAILRGLCEQHPELPHLLRVIRRPG